MAAASLSARITGLFGSEQAILQHAFHVVEKRQDPNQLKVLLGCSDLSQFAWSRSWTDPAHRDLHAAWESHAHSAADARTPLMSALLALPRHSVLAGTQRNRSSLHAVVKQAGSTSLLGMSAQSALQDEIISWHSLGEAARMGAKKWRLWASSVLLEHGGTAISQARDAFGRTALHHAAASGDDEIVMLLLENDADVEVLDNLARTAAHVAAAHGYDKIAALIADQSRGVSESLQRKKDVFGFTIQDILMLRTGCREHIPCLDAISMTDLYREYMSLNRPVLIRDGASHLPAIARWSGPRQIMSLLRGRKLTHGLIPYRGAEKSTLEDFLSVAQATSPAGELGPQPYVFDVSVGIDCPNLLQDARLFPDKFRERSLAYIRQPQFGLGFEGAGAPMHSHYAAVNALFTGSKQWFLLPPSMSFWAFEPSASWTKSQECQQLRAEGHLLEVSQQAGDLLFVPGGWGHATLLESFSVGIGQELISNACMAS